MIAISPETAHVLLAFKASFESLVQQYTGKLKDPSGGAGHL